MVMRKNAMRKNLRQSILKSLGRYLAIVAIIALGASMFVGLLMTKSDMVATGQGFMDRQNMFDLRLVNSYGWTQAYVDAVAKLDGVVDAEGIMYTDLVVRVNDSTEDAVYRFYAMPETVNRFELRGGRMPESEDECLADGYRVDDSILGTRITVVDTNTEDSLETVSCRTYTVVGYVASPLYMDMNRGTTSVGNGSLANYIYVSRDALNMDYYAEINITIPGDYDIYSDAYNEAMENAADALEPELQKLADARLEEIKAEAEESYQEGLQELLDGIEEFEKGKLEARKQIEEGRRALLEAEQEIADNEKLLTDGEQQIAAGWVQLAEGEAELEAAREQIDQLKGIFDGMMLPADSAILASYNDAVARQQELQAEINAIDAQLDAIYGSMEGGDQLSSLETQISQLDSQISSLNAQIQAAQAVLDMLNVAPNLNAALISELSATISSLTAQRDSLQAQRDGLQAEYNQLSASLAGPLAQIKELETQKDVLEAELNDVNNTVAMYEAMLSGILDAQESLEQMLAETEAELAAGEQQLADGKAQLAAMEQQLADGKAALEEGKAELEKAWKEYYDGKAQAEAELSKAQAEISDAMVELSDARDLLDKMTSNKIMILDRNSNIGYNSLDSASDIVQGVSRVFPAFFLLVAALVCITTMTRMIDEERTQIGTLKALGYSNGAIISKYLVYAGSGAVVGCGLGVLIGSAVFPMILWEAYKIMLYITDDIVLQVNWGLCGIVVGAYTAVMLLVTWYCCRRTLREEPAELIRPKAPDPGKKILLEYLPFWKNISFLNKVTIRNIFRYRQRLAMMMVGIGGCTALLVTGYGLRDSIVNVVDYQFQEVTTYDMSVYFTGGQTPEEQQEFMEDVAFGAKNVMFYHQSSIDLDFDGSVKEIYLIAGGQGISEFIDMHTDETPIRMPGRNEVVLSVGVAEAMGIDIGEKITLRNADMQILELTVSGIYDNHVYNYAIISPDTIAAQWGEVPEMQMAFIKVKDGQSAHELSAEITGLNDVMNVSVSEDLAGMVGNMMEALDLVVIVIVICAGALAAIVLYNLTNININERIREIATIKVLGFNAGETAAYVFKENLSLSAIGSIVGLGLGYLLLLFVMSQIKIDMVWFKAMVLPASYGISIALTMLAACIVDFIFYFKLDKINMAEALKSVE